MKNYKILFGLLITFFTFIIVGRNTYADVSQMKITKNNVVVFSGDGQTGGWAYSIDGKSKTKLYDMGGGASAVADLGRYVVLYSWEGYQSEKIGIFDSDNLKCIWFKGYYIKGYSLSKEGIYWSLAPVEKALGGEDTYAFTNQKGDSIMLQRLDKKIKFSNIPHQENKVSDVKLSNSVTQGTGNMSTILDKKYNKKYDGIKNISCFQADSKNIYVIQMASEYGAPPLSYFILINRQSGAMKKEPLFINLTSSLQIYGNKLMFYGQNYYTSKNGYNMEFNPAVFLIDKNGKNIKPLYKDDGTPSDNCDILRSEKS